MRTCSVSICIPIYNNVRNFKSLIDSIRATGWLQVHDHEILVYNDGSTLSGVDDEARAFCSLNGIRYLSGAINRGVPYSWNMLCEAASSEIIVLVNDDLRCGSENWIRPILFSFSENDRLGIVYWCQRLIDPATGLPRRLTTDSLRLLEQGDRLPVLRHNFCGAFFSYRKSIWNSIKQPDGSTGFWNDLVSYGEEFDLSAETLNRGYFILQLPAVWDHLHSQTFLSNPDKKLRVALSPYLTLEEFRHSAGSKPSPRRSAGNALRRLARLLTRNRKSQDNVSALDYSMAMLHKKWTSRTILGMDAPWFLAQMRLDGFPMALRSAIEAGTFTAPDTIAFCDVEDNETRLPWHRFMDEGRESLV